VPVKFTGLEIIAIDVIGRIDKFRIACAYRAKNQNENREQEQKQITLLGELVSLLCDVDYSFVLCGDLNLPDLCWQSSSVLSSSNNRVVHDIFLDACLENGLNQYVLEPTQKTANNILDVVLYNNDVSVFNVEVTEPFSAECDHLGVAFNLNFEPSREKKKARKYRNFKKGNYEAINEYLMNVDFAAIIRASDSVDALYRNIIDVQNYCIETWVPLSEFRPHKVEYPDHIKRLRARKRRLHKLSKRTPIGKDLYKKCAKVYDESVRDYRDLKEDEVVRAGSVRGFYDFVNAKLKSNSDIPPLRRDCGSFTDSPKEKAEIMNKFFASVLTVDDNACPSFDRKVPDHVGINTVQFPVEIVMKKLKKLPSKLSKTPDKIPAFYWKSVASCVAEPLARLFELSMTTETIPELWREAWVIPIHKKGIASLASNYRPISLTCICCKVMESIVADALLLYLRARNLLSKHQFGFLSKRSTGLQLLSTLNDWTKAVRDKKHVNSVYIDYQKAFDSVSHPKLLTKLRGYGIDYELFAWIGDFLRNRTQCVVIDDAFSDPVSVISGVPQGSVLGPLLFLLYINDMPDCLGNDTSVKLYADDAKLYIIQDKGASIDNFQASLTKFEEWSAKWQLRIAFSKCFSLSIGFGNVHAALTLGDKALDEVCSVRDLGITVCNDLKPSKYCTEIAAKALARLALLFRVFRTKNKEVLIRAFTTYVRPLVEYETSVWSPYYKKDIERIEQVQRVFTRRLYRRCGWKKPDYMLRLKNLGLDSLESRRVKNDLVMCYKIVTNKVDIDHDEFFSFADYVKTRSNGCKLRIAENPRVDVRKFFFSVRVCKPWNTLDSSIVSSSSVASFSSKLTANLLSNFTVLY
jgi:hypothetical protein